MPSTIKRQSAAVMFTDIAGYTSIMASDEEKALSLLKDKRKILKPLIKQHDGVYVKGTGDGTLSYFDSAYNASKCAKLFQESIYDNKNMNVRVGIHVGDIVLDDGDVYGDGVNVASRLESMSPVGGICVSNTVYDELRNKKEFDGVELGLQSLKGVGRLIEIYGLKGDLLTEPKPSDYQDNKVAVHSDDEVPSIAIIPLKNKGDDKDIFYAYGISADLISDCSGAGLIRVESLDNIEKVENHDKLSAQELASKLFVRYIATGTLWKMDNMFQLSIELYDTKESKVVWSDRWQENWDNLVAIKGKLSDGLLKSLNKKPLITSNIETTNTEAYEYYLKGKYKMWGSRKNLEDIEIARGLLQKSIDLDNNLILAKNDIGWSYALENNLEKAMEIFKSTLIQCEKIGDIREIGHVGLGHVYRCKGEFRDSVYHINRSITIDEKLGNLDWVASAQREMAVCYSQIGDFGKSFDYIKQSIEIYEKLGDKIGLGIDFHFTSLLYYWTGKIDRAWEYAYRSLEICEQFDSFDWVIFLPLFDLGLYNFDRKEYDIAIEYFEKSISIQKRVAWKGEGVLVWATTLLYLSYKKIGKKYDESLLLLLIKENEYLEEDIYFLLYQLLEDTTYLETAYNQVQEKTDNLEPDVAAKFLRYPIPKAIVEEWEKVK